MASITFMPFKNFCFQTFKEIANSGLALFIIFLGILACARNTLNIPALRKQTFQKSLIKIASCS